MMLLIKHWRIVLSLLLTLIIATLLLVTSHYRNRYHAVEIQRDIALQQQRSAETISKNVIKSVSLFNDIAASTQEKKDNAKAQSEVRIVEIRKATEGDKCAALPVPFSAADGLRKHRDKIRSGTLRTDTLNPHN